MPGHTAQRCGPCQSVHPSHEALPGNPALLAAPTLRPRNKGVPHKVGTLVKFMGVAEGLGWDHLTMTSPCPCRYTASQHSTWLHFRFESVQGIESKMSVSERDGSKLISFASVLIVSLTTAMAPADSFGFRLEEVAGRLSWITN